MAGRGIRLQSVFLFATLVAIVMVVTMVLASGQPTDIQIFIILLNGLLVLMNVISYFLLLGSASTMVDEIFVMTPSGMLIKHYTRRLKPDQDDDILAGMLTAVQNFVKESLDSVGGKLNEIRFENYDIIITYSENLVVAAVLSTRNPQKLKEKMRATVSTIEKECGDKLKNWGGDLSELKSVDDAMKELLGHI